MTRPTRHLPIVLATLAAALASAPAPAQEAAPRHVPGLGSLHFPVTGSEEARPHFERGVLLLHSFEYEDARAAFERAREIDPDFAMAYWGEAMTHTHPVWNEKDADAARAALARYAPTPDARAAKAPSERERAWLGAVDVLYADAGDSKAALDTAYAEAMERLVERFPDDDEARAFHALALLGLSQGDRDVPTYMRAGAIALDVFERNPDHPGAAHYVIHAFDDPAHAPLGLEAARAYSGIAPDAAHAQHMTTHIFLALGMWDGVVAQNEQADAVVDRQRAERGMPQTDCGHYNEWLLYGYQQQGRDGDAAALLRGCREMAREGAAGPRSPIGSYLFMRAQHLADTEDWDGEFGRDEVGADVAAPWLASARDWADAMAAIGRGELEAGAARARAVAERAEAGDLGGYGPVWAGTLEAALLRARGDLEGAVAAATRAADAEAALPVDFGPPISFKPPRELQGEMLLEAGRAEEAMTAFRTALGRTPRRARALEGYAAAAEAAGETALAERVLEELAGVGVGGGGGGR